MSNIPETFLPYGYQTIEQDDIDAVATALKSNFLTTGPRIAEFEAKLCEITQAQEAVVCGNGTQALHLACLAIGLGEGDAAVVPSLTFLATANAVRYCGAEVVFCDVDPQTGLMRAQDLQVAIEAHQGNPIKAVLPVHLAGQAVDLQAIRIIADTHDLTIIADSCHALGGSYGDAPIGAGKFEDMAVFSFHPVKTIAMGEGGAITTNNADYAAAMRLLRSHGMELRPEQGPWVYVMEEIGYNYRATDIQCALGVSQLGKLSRFVEKRQSLARHYDQLLHGLSAHILPPKRGGGAEPAWHLYAPRFDFDALKLNRAELMIALKERNIGTQVHYIPVHSQPYYRNRYPYVQLPGADAYYAHTLSLPLFPAMCEEDVDIVVENLKDLLAL